MCECVSKCKRARRVMHSIPARDGDGDGDDVQGLSNNNDNDGDLPRFPANAFLGNPDLR